MNRKSTTSQKRQQARQTRDAVQTTAAQTAVETLNALGEGVALCYPDGRIREVNPAFAALTDCSTGELEGLNIREVLPGLFDEPDQTVRETVARVQLKHTADDPADALTVTTGNGVHKWVIPTLTDIHGPDKECAGIVLCLRDITSLVQARASLMDNERKYRELVENANSIIMRMTPDLRIRFFNEYAQTLFGFTAESIINQSVLGTIIPERDAEGRDLSALVAGIAAHPEEHGTVDIESVCRDGRRIWVHWSNRAIRDEQGAVKEVLCVGTDITDRKRLEQEAAESRQRLRALAGRLSETEERERRRMATLIHDSVIQSLSLSNIRLGGVVAALNHAGLEDVEKRVVGVRQLLDQGARECRALMETLVQPLLYEVGFEAALREFAERHSKADGTPITVTIDDQVDPIDETRRGLLFQCVRELMVNALKHAGPCAIHISVSNGPDAIVLRVADDGCGFDPAAVQASGRDGCDGGFGLFNIRERINGAGGDVDIQSAPGQGTIATVRMPRRRAV